MDTYGKKHNLIALTPEKDNLIPRIKLAQQTHRHLTPLSELQKTILVLLDISPSIYDRLGAESPKPT
jgi:hypothetical protein